MLNRTYNWKPAPFDQRDIPSTRHFKVFKEVMPSEYQLPPLPIFDQLNEGSCTANTGCTVYMLEYFQKTGNFGFSPSRHFVYWNERFLEGTINEDSGAYIISAFKAMKKWGLCEEVYFPYSEPFTNPPTEESLRNGLNNLVVRYTSVPQSELTLKQTIFSGAAISFGFYVYESFEFVDWDKITGTMPIPDSREQILGGHAVTIVGWNDTKQCFLIQNSWGKQWGLQGLFWMPYSFLLSGNCSDFWCIDEIKIMANVPPYPESTALEFARGIFKTENQVNAMQETSIVELGLMLGLDTDAGDLKSLNVRKVWQKIM